MAEQLAFNEDCLEAMRRMEDKCFDLAVVDPPYGGVGQGEYMANKSSGRPSELSHGTGEFILVVECYIPYVLNSKM